MIRILLPGTGERKVSFYLAAEEYVARNIDAEEAFLTWQVSPSVIFGRNQLIENEVDTSYCREHGVEMFRRKSGGGCVYADKGNLMLAYVTKSDLVKLTFYKYVNMLVCALRHLGIHAVANGRNDVLIGDKKVSGNAFYHLPGRCIVHGTLLYDTDMQNMLHCITPQSEKLMSKGVDSVRQRIALLKDHTQLPLSEIRNTIENVFCSDELALTAEDVRNIEKMEQEYLSPSFILGHNPKYTLIRRERIEGVGTLEVRMEMKNNIINDIHILGDYFLNSDIGELCNRMKGVGRNWDEVWQALPDNVDKVIMNLNKTDLTTLITK